MVADVSCIHNTTGNLALLNLSEEVITREPYTKQSLLTGMSSKQLLVLHRTKKMSVRIGWVTFCGFIIVLHLLY